jgi:hypothetical protein
LREKFRDLLDCPLKKVFDVVAQSLGTGLEKRPEAKPSDPTELDRYERLIEATRLTKREQDAFELYWYGMENFHHLGWVLGEYQLGHRILAAFSTTGRAEDLASTMDQSGRSLLANDLALYAFHLGRLADAWAICQVDDRWSRSLGEAKQTSIALQNSARVTFAWGSLIESRVLADEGLTQAEAANDDVSAKNSIVFRGAAAHALGDIPCAKADFASATHREGSP